MKGKKNTVILIAGPTASGKTGLAVRLARQFRTEIISSDSRQCYREMNIGVARPSVKELASVKHHFIASHSVKDNLHAAFFEQYALEKTEELFRDHDTVIMAGGTGLYIKAFCEGLDEMPPVAAGIRQKIMEGYEKHGLEWLQKEIALKDPLFYQQGEIKNPRRIMRALEMAEATGRSILTFRKQESLKRDFTVIKIALDLPREELQENISVRTEQMFASGLIEEVSSLRPYKDLNALQTVGYKEVFEHLEGKLTLEETIRQVKQHTRQYAKRQLTWFRKDKDFRWFPPSQEKEIVNYINEFGN